MYDSTCVNEKNYKKILPILNNKREQKKLILRLSKPEVVTNEKYAAHILKLRHII